MSPFLLKDLKTGGGLLNNTNSLRLFPIVAALPALLFLAACSNDSPDELFATRTLPDTVATPDDSALLLGDTTWQHYITVDYDTLTLDGSQPAGEGDAGNAAARGL